MHTYNVIIVMFTLQLKYRKIDNCEKCHDNIQKLVKTSFIKILIMAIYHSIKQKNIFKKYNIRSHIFYK